MILPEGKFSALLCDPPWHHASRSAKGQTTRSPSHHYQTMNLADICALPIQGVAERDCHLFLWTTQPHLEQSFAVLKAWGFKYSSVFLFWMKLNPRAADQMFLTAKDFSKGMGFTTRKNVELLILGRRGSPKRLRKDIPDILIAPRRQHSRKPDSSYTAIEDYCPGPRLELFGRQQRPGWVVAGDEANKFDGCP